ncbi:MAG: WD40 repeat domain-containing protein [Lachnospiraceae bacterium]|nr:WD40 repeat domain-containing protein [Lachnospiraceae bacterium]
MEKNEKVTLCGANSYLKKYYFNEDFAALPDQVKKELNIMCVLFTEEAGGILTMEFSPEGDLLFTVSVDDADYLFDEIESGLQIRKLQKEHEKLLRGIEQYYKIRFLGMDPADVLTDEDTEGMPS